jgi:outer membrane protein
MESTNTNSAGMKRKILFATVALLMITVCEGQTTKLTLKDCIDTALRNNIAVQQTELTMQNARVNYRQAQNNRLPNVQSLFNYGVNNGRSIDPFTNSYIDQQLKSSDMSVQASIPLFSGFQLKNSIKQNEMAFAGASMEWQQKKDELTLQVILAYLQVLASQDAIVLAQQQAEVSKQQFDRLDIINREGATPPGNYADMKGQYAGDRVAVVNAENNFSTSVLSLTQLMNIPYSDKLEFDRVGVDKEVTAFTQLPDEIYALATQKLAGVKATEFRIKSSEAATKVAAAARYPTVSLYGGASTNYSSLANFNNLVSSSFVPNGEYITYNNEQLKVMAQQDKYTSTPISYESQFKNNISTGVGVSMRIPIFNSFRTKSAIQLAKNDEKSYRLIADNVKQQLRQGIEQAYVNINAVYKRYQALKEQVDAYGESFRIASLRFENGVINSPEYLIAKNNLDRANANLVIAQYEYLLRKKILEFYMGSL